MTLGDPGLGIHVRFHHHSRPEQAEGQRLGMSDWSGRWQQHFLVNKVNPYGGQEAGMERKGREGVQREMAKDNLRLHSRPESCLFGAACSACPCVLFYIS